MSAHQHGKAAKTPLRRDMKKPGNLTSRLAEWLKVHSPHARAREDTRVSAQAGLPKRSMRLRPWTFTAPPPFPRSQCPKHHWERLKPWVSAIVPSVPTVPIDLYTALQVRALSSPALCLPPLGQRAAGFHRFGPDRAGFSQAPFFAWVGLLFGIVRRLWGRYRPRRPGKGAPPPRIAGRGRGPVRRCR